MQGANWQTASMGRNLKNAVIAFVAPLPSLIFYLYFLGYCSEHGCGISSPSNSSSGTHLSPLWNWCYNHPILLANLFFLLNVDLLFWLIGLLQSSNWVSASLSLSWVTNALFVSAKNVYFSVFGCSVRWETKNSSSVKGEFVKFYVVNWKLVNFGLKMESISRLGF